GRARAGQLERRRQPDHRPGADRHDLRPGGGGAARAAPVVRGGHQPEVRVHAVHELRRGGAAAGGGPELERGRPRRGRPPRGGLRHLSRAAGAHPDRHAPDEDPMRLMRGRTGFTLVELMIGIILAGVVGLAITRMVMTTQRVSRAQAQQTDLQGSMRTGALLLPAELREMGFDHDSTGAEIPDILDARADRITLRVMRGWAIMCGDYAVDEILLRLPVIGYRNPTTRDSLLLFTENELDKGSDDQWTPFSTNEIRIETCPEDGERALSVRQLDPNEAF